MKDPRHTVVVAFALLACACGDGHDDSDLSNPETAVAESLPPPARPMPRLGQRVEAVMAELGPEADELASTLSPPPHGDHRRWHRASLAALSPHARASLRRHNVRIEQLARHLASNSEGSQP